MRKISPSFLTILQRIAWGSPASLAKFVALGSEASLVPKISPGHTAVGFFGDHTPYAPESYCICMNYIQHIHEFERKMVRSSKHPFAAYCSFRG